MSITVMGSQQSINLASYEDVLALKAKKGLLVSTLPPTYQECLIPGTVLANEEEAVLNSCIERRDTKNKVVVYGRNCTDRSPYRKLEQLLECGFGDVAVYPGGMLEWMLLTDAYGTKAFGTTGVRDIMDFAPARPQ